MIILRIYALVWVFVLAAAGGLYFTGLLNDVTLHILGFVCATLLAMGFVAVLPVLMDHFFAPRTYSPARLARIAKRRKLAKVRSVRKIHGGSSNVT